ncbi:hypothetical protein LCGC14_1882510 [marine sediment metagenome]|uniref:Uncharacterized protein n=1 Tax=marine sediment metagenome TaxID=412755 RepID=A0A0F9G1X2_9ZZZZ
MADDIHEVYLIPAERHTDCLVCSDSAEPLVELLHSGIVRLCIAHLAETQQRADAAEGMHLQPVEG